MKLVTTMLGPRWTRVFLCALLGAPLAHADGLDFDKTFSDKGEAKRLHYQATYYLGGTNAHQVEVWRMRDQHLKRKTDANLETHVFKAPKEAEWRMVMLDASRKIRTDIDRSNLYRIGNFIDWFGLAHALSRPVGPYQLSAIATAPDEKALGPCRWYAYTYQERTSKICWSQTHRIPLLILDASDKVQWKVTAIDNHPIADSVFAIHDSGYVRNNANDDIKAD